MYCPQIQLASEPARQAIAPNIIILPMSAPSRAAAARGPGVGGTIACVSCNEPTRPIDMTLIVTFMTLAAECTSGLRITYATSEKIAMPSTKPVSVNASGILDEPTTLTIVRVMVWIAPVCRSASAMMDPSTMTTPIEPSVLPKPFSNASMKLFVCTPGIRPNSNSGISNARKTCQRHFAMRNNNRMITPRKAISASSGLVTTAVVGSITACSVQGRLALPARHPAGMEPRQAPDPSRRLTACRPASGR